MGISLGFCDDCLVLDDELIVLPFSRGKVMLEGEASSATGHRSHEDTKPVRELVKLAMTPNQAKALLTFVDAIAEKTLSSTESVWTAACGRGKSAALGLASAAATTQMCS